MVFRIYVFQVPGFLGSMFFKVQVQGPGPGFRSSLKIGVGQTLVYFLCKHDAILHIAYLK